MMSVFFYHQPTLNGLFNNCIKLYWYWISSSWNMEGGQTELPPPQNKLPSKSPGLLGLIVAWPHSSEIEDSISSFHAYIHGKNHNYSLWRYCLSRKPTIYYRLREFVLQFESKNLVRYRINAIIKCTVRSFIFVLPGKNKA